MTKMTLLLTSDMEAVAGDSQKFEEILNSFIQNRKVIDIKFSMASADQFGALVIYEYE